MENIEKLREKVEKDPTSTLFVPLAEEYRKIGELDNAIMVLKSGIERQPGYMSARVSLGKIYLEKDMKTDAVIEFEKVVDAIPDNLFAQRKLADLYNELGKRDMAIARYEAVLSLNPLDEEAQEIIEELKTRVAEAPDEAVEEPASAVQEDVAPEETFAEQEEEETLIGLDKPPDWSSAMEAESSVSEPMEAAAPEEAEKGGVEVPLESGKERKELLDATESAGYTPVEENVENVESTLEALSEPEGSEAVSDEPAEITNVQGEAEVSKTEQALQAEPEERIDIKEADQCIELGDYAKAMKIYNAHLKENPKDSNILQRVDELRSLLKLIGRENDLIESELYSFLEAVKGRRDEFFGSS